MTSACLKPAADVAVPELDALGDVGGRLGRRLDAGGDHVLVQDRRAGLHGLDHVDDVGKHLVVDLDELQGLLGDGGAGGRHGRHGVAFVERLLARHHVAHHVAVVDHHLARRDELGGLILEVLAGDDGLDARQLRGRAGVDRPDAGVRMRASQHLADQLALHGEVGAELGAARHLVDAVGAQRARADPLELGAAFAVDLLLHRSGSSHLGGGVEHRAHDLVVAGAAAQVAGQPVAHLRLGGVRALFQQRLGGDQEARRADAALQRGVLQELALQRVQLLAAAPCPRWCRSTCPAPPRPASGRSTRAGRRP